MEGQRSRGARADRRRELIRIAYHQLAERGFEGLRVRDVANAAGVNIATLHYYFPTKEDLIYAVIGYLAEQFQVPAAAPVSGENVSALEELRWEFADLRERIRTAPEQIAVLAELHARARRDANLAAALRGLDAGWQGYLASIIERGIREGIFRGDLEPSAAAEAIVAQMKGIGYQLLSDPDSARADRLVAELAEQVERWLRH